MKKNNKTKTKLILSCLLVLIALSIFAISAFAANNNGLVVLDKNDLKSGQIKNQLSFDFYLDEKANCTLTFEGSDMELDDDNPTFVNGDKVRVGIRIVNNDSKTVFSNYVQDVVKYYEYWLDAEYKLTLPHGWYTLILEPDQKYAVPDWSCVIKAVYLDSNLQNGSIALAQGQTKELKVYSPYSGRIPYGEFYETSSSNEKVATVTTRGVVKGLALGKATITIIYDDVNDFDNYDDKVYKADIVVNSAKASLYIGQTKSVRSYIKHVQNYESATWTSDNKSVVSITKSGKATVKAVGKAVLTAKVDGQKYKLNVTVPKVKLSQKSASVYVGKTLKLKLSAASGQTTWSSSNTKVATVSKKGTVKAKRTGKATITATFAGKKYACTVTVKKAAYGSVSGTVVYGGGFSSADPDTGSTVYVIDPSNNSILGKALVDGSGNYTVRNVLAGKCVVIIVSCHCRTWEDDETVYGIDVSDFYYYTYEDTMVYANQTTDCSARFIKHV